MPYTFNPLSGQFDYYKETAIGSTISGATAGPVFFGGTGGTLQQDTTFVYDDTNNRLGIGTASPTAALDIRAVPASGVPVLAARSTADTTQATVEFYSHTGNAIFTLKQNPSTSASGIITNVTQINGLDSISLSSSSGVGSSSAISINSGNFVVGYNSASTYGYLATRLAAGLSFQVNSIERLAISTAGNVLVNGFTSSTVGLTVKGAAAQSANLTEWQNSSASIFAKVTAAGSFSNAYGTTGGEIFGDGATITSGSNHTVIGNGATASGATGNSVAIGKGASVSGNGRNVAIGSASSCAGESSVAIGWGTTASASSVVIIGASASGSGVSIGTSSVTGVSSVALGGTATTTTAVDAVALGYNTTATRNGVAIGKGATADAGGERGSVAIGKDANNATFYSTAIGKGATNTAHHQLVFGSTGTDNYIDDVYIGNGVTAASPQAFKLNASGGSGADVAGASLTIAGGKATGNATGGSILFQTSDAGASSSTLQSLTTKVSIAASGTMSTMNIEPATDNTHYLGRNDDDSPKAWKGVILKDQVSGTYYRIEMISGTLTATDLTD